jgi:hypothetical protein
MKKFIVTLQRSSFCPYYYEWFVDEWKVELEAPNYDQAVMMANKSAWDTQCAVASVEGYWDNVFQISLAVNIEKQIFVLTIDRKRRDGGYSPEVERLVPGQELERLNQIEKESGLKVKWFAVDVSLS